MSTDLVEQLYTIRKTPYGGRGAFAQTLIKAGTCIQRCPTPYAYVIARKFRKEVCAWCFKYAFEHGRSTWGWKYAVTDFGVAPTPGGRTKSKGAGGLKECRSNWCLEMDVGGLHAALNTTLEKLTLSDKERKAADNRKFTVHSILNDLGDLPLARVLQEHWMLLSSVDYERGSSINDGHARITSSCQTLPYQEQLDIVWRQAELFYTPSKQHSRHGQLHREHQLTEFELDTARFVISAFVRRFSEENAADVAQMQQDDSAGPAATWSDMLQLQNNEVETALWKPQIIASHLRVYGFARRVVEATLQVVGAVDGKRDWGRLRTYVEKSNSVRALLGRDHGNVFGIWDMVPQGDSEMLGWGMYVQGSFFNHDCYPNVKKQRVDRAMNFYAIRDVMPGEELCISYIHEADPVPQRRAELKEEWYFDCTCGRCQREFKELEMDIQLAASAEVVVDSGYISQTED
ncbi:hypothetical protein AX15_007112 [Amanita polypyramis BW_CC]|nr:hypothetical protein AX15_007112 [Amanita polypyramis BW_CC]